MLTSTGWGCGALLLCFLGSIQPAHAQKNQLSISKSEWICFRPVIQSVASNESGPVLLRFTPPDDCTTHLGPVESVYPNPPREVVLSAKAALCVQRKVQIIDRHLAEASGIEIDLDACEAGD
jgi:hypothetical protein